MLGHDAARDRAVLALACTLLASCGERSCLEASAPCTIASPCPRLEVTCESPVAPSVRRLREGEEVSRGLAALAASGDVVIENGVIVAVIDALEHPHYVAPTGGNLLDLSTLAGDDSLSHVFSAVGLLPGDAVAYDEMTLVEGEGFAAVQVIGHLAGAPRVRVATRYEARSCEPGLRVRTEIANGTAEPRVWALVDAWYWSGRATLPFAPGPGRGFTHAPIPTPQDPSFESAPFFAAASHADPAAAYFAVSCSDRELHGFHSEQLSGVGMRPSVVQPRDVRVLERFVGVVPGRAIGPAADVALELRRQLFDEPYATLRGEVRALDGDLLDDEVRAAIVIEEVPRDGGDRVPWTQLVPDAEGRYAARVPADRRYRVEARAFGRAASSVELDVGIADAVVPPLELDAAAMVEVTVLVDGAPDWGRVVVRAANDETRESVRARLLDGYSECTPLLGSPTGSSPACARMLVHDPLIVRMPPGRYDFFASAGPFATVARATRTLEAGELASIELSLERLSVAPEGTLSADFHVHGSGSFDSTLPDHDRVASFLAANVEVVVATDHDVVSDYREARAALGADARVRVVPGVESTGHILFDLTPGARLPQVIGHWNVWPLPFAPDAPYRGAPWDELAEPGLLFTRFADAGWDPRTGVIQLNHPWAAPQISRDFGFPRAVGVDLRVPLPRELDGTGQGLVLRTPEGARFGNGDYHVQEVMNGTSNTNYLPYRAYWFYLLNQGILRAGTANSDSHTLVDNLIGTPRTLVWTDQTVASFDVVAFDRDVRAGRMLGTNGPIIEVSTTDASGGARTPSMQPFVPDEQGDLRVIVRAAPWVPVDEVRVIVNGRVARAFEAELADPPDPFGREGVIRLDASVSLRELLPDEGDAWIVVEAGSLLAENGDLNCDGVPDTGDNDGDGTIDWRDVDRNGDRVVDDADAALLGEAPPCDARATVGPLARPPVPERGERGYTFRAVVPGGYPAAFTNPLLLDRGAPGFTGPGLP